MMEVWIEIELVFIVFMFFIAFIALFVIFWNFVILWKLAGQADIHENNYCDDRENQNCSDGGLDDDE